MRCPGISGYGLFLFHRPLFVPIEHWFGPVACVIAGPPLAAGLGMPSHVCIEASAIRRSRVAAPTQ